MPAAAPFLVAPSGDTVLDGPKGLPGSTTSSPRAPNQPIQASIAAFCASGVSAIFPPVYRNTNFAIVSPAFLVGSGFSLEMWSCSVKRVRRRLQSAPSVELCFGRCVLRRPLVRSGITATACDGKPGEVVTPARGVRLHGLEGQPAVHETHDGVVTVGREGDLDGARPGRDGITLVLPTPREGHPVRRAHFDVLAAGDVGAIDVDPVDAPRVSVDLVVDPLPASHLVGVGEKG